MKLHTNLPKFNDNSYAHFVTTKTYRNYPFFGGKELARIVKEELEFYAAKYNWDM